MFTGKQPGYTMEWNAPVAYNHAVEYGMAGMFTGRAAAYRGSSRGVGGGTSYWADLLMAQVYRQGTAIRLYTLLIVHTTPVHKSMGFTPVCTMSTARLTSYDSCWQTS